MSFLASNLNFIFLFISLIYVFNYDGVRTTAKDIKTATITAAAAARKKKKEKKK
jgi:hypothetical protein